MLHSSEEVPGTLLWSSSDGRASFYNQHEPNTDSKILLRIACSSEAEAEAMGKILASLHTNPHQNICECLDWKTGGWFVDWLMPYPGENLSTLVERRAAESVYFREEDLFELSTQLIKGQAFLGEKGLAFPVIYPEFVFSSEPNVYRVCSIGVFKNLKSEFLSPSLKTAASWTDAGVNATKSCVYSVGECLLYASLLRVCENTEQALMEVRNKYSESWASYLSCMLQENDSHRPSFSELIMIRDEERIEEKEPSHEDVPPLELSVYCGLQYVRITQTHAEQVPCMITLQGRHLGPDREECDTDLVCVIDVSGSMSGELLDQVKESLKNQLIAGMRPPDRMSFITFSNEVQLHCPLTICSEVNRMHLREIVNKFTTHDLTNLAAGFKMGLNVLKCRKTKNKKAVLLLFTDGQDNLNEDATEECCKALDEAEAENLRVLCFGYQREIDKHLLATIAKRKDGEFKHIFEPEEINKAFGNAFKEFSTEIARNITITLKKCEKTRVGIQAFDVLGREETTEVRIAHLFANEEKHIVFSLVPKFQTLSEPDSEEAIEVEVDYEDISGFHIRLQKTLQIHFVPGDCRIPSNLDGVVYTYFYRAQANKVFVDAKKKIYENKIDEASQLLYEGIEHLEAMNSAQGIKSTELIDDMIKWIVKIRGHYDIEALKKLYVVPYTLKHESMKMFQRQ